jgi:hypothetical protein
MKTLIPVLVLPLALPSLACQSIKAAPEGSPRVEVELAVEVDPAVYDPFAEEVDRAQLRALIEDTVLPLSDVGLRFYPVPTEAYQDGDVHPEYALTIHVQRFDVLLEHKLIEVEGQAPFIRTTLEQADAHSSVVFERRREGAPPLLVGSAQGAGDAKVVPEETGDLLLRHETQDGESILLPHASFTHAIEESVEKALGLLQKPIDREFQAPAPPAPTPARS